MGGLNDLNSAARIRESIIKIANEVLDKERPRPRYATVQSIDKVARTVEVKYPDETATFVVPCGALIPMNVGQVVRINGLTGSRYVEDIIGEASFDGDPIAASGAQTFVANSQAAMLALAAVRGDICVRTDQNKSYILKTAPATVLANWQELLQPDATAIANNAISNHEAAANPHPIYLTQTEADALYVGSSSISSAISSHEAAADPHPGYVRENGGSVILASGTGVLPLTLRGALGQVADLFQILDGGGVTKLYVTAAGVLTADGAGITNLNASNIASGTLASGRLPATIAANTTGSAAKWTTPRTITLGGDLTGSVNIDGSANVTLTATVAANAVALGTDTTGNYIATIAGTANQITVTGSGAESAAVTLSLPQNIHTAATPTFAGLTVTGDITPRGGSTFWDASFTSTAAADLAWKAVATVGTPVGLYVGAEFEIDVLFKSDNFAHMTAPFRRMTFGVTIMRSGAVQDDTDNGAVWGPVAEYVRLVRVDIATWEIQIRQAVNYTTLKWRIRRLVHNGTTLTWGGANYAALPAGNSVGTIIYAESTHKFEHWFAKVDTKLLSAQPWVATDVPVVIKGATSQSANLTEWQTAGGSVVASVSSTGAIIAANGIYSSTNVASSFGGATINSTILAVHANAAGNAPLRVRGAAAQSANLTEWQNSGGTAMLSVTPAGVLSSTVATGTAPLVVASTTVVTNLNADKLDGNDAAYFASQSSLETLLGDLMYVGTYNAGTYVGTDLTKPHPTWTGGTNVYRHGMYWIVSGFGNLDFIDTDLSGRYVFGADDPVDVYPGDWIIATNPSFNPASPNVNLALADITFQVIRFSAETFVKAQIQAHKEDIEDPHSAAGYLTQTTADPLYAQVVHNHDGEYEPIGEVALHEAAVDPHPQYLTPAEGQTLYSEITHQHPGVYEAYGAVDAHIAAADPHPEYLTQPEGDARYALVGHDHSTLYYLKAQVDAMLAALPPEVYATDGAQSKRIYVGDQTPAGHDATNGIGDIWIVTNNISLQKPGAASGFTASSPTGTTINLSWSDWPTGAAVTRVRLQRRNGADWTTVAPTTLVDDSVAPLATTYSDTGRAENTTYYYRLWATNATGDSDYAYLTVTSANDAPGVPTGLAVSNQTSTGMRLSWTAPSPFTDPAASGSIYEVFVNGASVGYASTTNTYYDVTGLSENTTVTLGVRAKDSAGLFSSTASTSGTTTNANPPVPASPASSLVTYNSARLSWSAVSAADFLRYRVYKDDVQVATTTNTYYDFTGLSETTTYKLEVRAEDAAGALSTDNGAYVNVTTLTNPDTTPPSAPTINYFKPNGAYGRMEVSVTWPATTTYGIIDININGTNRRWEGADTAGTTKVLNSYTQWTVAATNGSSTAYTSAWARDAAGNTSAAASSNYTLVASPTYITADATNVWRNTNGGEYNAAGNYRPIQGYYSNSAYNARGMWYYGTKPYTQLYYSGRRTITGGKIYMAREAAGSGVYLDVVLVRHDQTASPGTVTGVAAPALTGTQTVIGQLNYPNGTGGDAAWLDLPSGWAELVVDGTDRGFATYVTSGSPYVVFSSITDNSSSGKLRFDHWG